MNFKDKIVIVTGSSRGIGREIAYQFAKKGALVILHGFKSVESLNLLERQIKKEGGKCQSFIADLSQYNEVEKMFEKILQQHKKVDILINNAGISQVGLFTDTTYEQWTAMVQTNLTSVYSCCHRILPSMIHHHSGTIINISSIWGVHGASCEVAYSATKGGINAFTKALAKEVGPSQIRVNAIACGVIDTDMNRWLSSDEKEELVESIPLMRFGQPKEVADLCLYLASSSSSYLTGQVIVLDGGMC